MSQLLKLQLFEVSLAYDSTVLIYWSSLSVQIAFLILFLNWFTNGIQEGYPNYGGVTVLLQKLLQNVRQSNQSIIVEFNLFEILEASVEKSLFKTWKETNAKTSRWSSNHGFLDKFAISSGSSNFVDLPKSNFKSWMVDPFGIQKSDKHFNLKFSSQQQVKSTMTCSVWPF